MHATMEVLMDKEVNKEMSSICRNLWNRRYGRVKEGEERMSQEDFDKELLYWSLQTVDSMRYIPLPPMPEALQDYYKSLPIDRKRVKTEFFQRPEIQRYIGEKHNVIRKNADDLAWLKELLDKIPPGDDANRKKVKDKIGEFETRSHGDQDMMAYEDSGYRPEHM